MFALIVNGKRMLNSATNIKHHFLDNKFKTIVTFPLEISRTTKIKGMIIASTSLIKSNNLNSKTISNSD
jgi:hypothetical protein